MNPYRHRLITQTLALLPSKQLICSAAIDAHRQQGLWPPDGRPCQLYQYRRRQQALSWLLDAVARSLQGHEFLDSYLRSQNLPNHQATLLHVRTAYLQDLLNHTKEDSPTLAFEDYLPDNLPIGPDLQPSQGIF